MMRFSKALIVIAFLTSYSVFAQDGTNPGMNFAKAIDQSLSLFYQEMSPNENYDSIMAALNYEANEIPEFTDAEYCERITKLADASPMPYQCNEASLKTVKFLLRKEETLPK